MQAPPPPSPYMHTYTPTHTHTLENVFHTKRHAYAPGWCTDKHLNTHSASVVINLRLDWRRSVFWGFKLSFRRISFNFANKSPSPAMPSGNVRDSLQKPISSPCCRCRCWPRLHPQCECVQREEAASQGHFQISLVGLSCGWEASWLTDCFS